MTFWMTLHIHSSTSYWCPHTQVYTIYVHTLITTLHSNTSHNAPYVFAHDIATVLRADYAYRVTNLSTAVRLRVLLSSLRVYSNL